MSISSSAPLTAISLPSIRNWRRRLQPILLLGGGLTLLLLGLSQSGDSLEAAQARWEAAAIADYRIVVEFIYPYLTCEQDFEVRSEQVTYRHRDTCSTGLSATGGQTQYPTVESLFQRIERELENPTCGSNGCACDGPIQVLTEYDPTLGYPSQIRYQLQPEMRWRYPDFWGNLLSGQTCPPVTFVGQTIRVTSLTRLKPVAPTLAPAPTIPTKLPVTPVPVDGVAANSDQRNN
jgi:hypothetical protein